MAPREIRPPGVYPLGAGARYTSLTIADTHVAGFVGIANRGPLDVPVLLQSWAEFIEVYGTTSEGHLARAVEGFFLNGGKSCYVVRVARRPRAGERLEPFHALQAERVLRDAWDKSTLRVLALNEGRWGNSVWVKTTRSTGAKTLLTLDLPVGAGQARVTSTRGIEKGSLLRIFDRDNSDYIVVTDIDEKNKTLSWGFETPVVRRYAAAAPTYVEVIEFELYASLRDRREVFKGLQLHPLSRRYAPRIINEESYLIRLEDQGSTSPWPNNLPIESPLDKLTGGRDGTEGITAEDFIGYDNGLDDRRGLMTLEHVEELGVICAPDAMIGICERSQDRFAILDAPDTRDIEEVRRMRQRLNTSFAAIYFPWVMVAGPNGTQHKVPPSGFVAGVYARTEQQSGVHKAPANEQILGLTQLTLPLSDDHLGQLNSEGINTIRAMTGRGIRIWGARSCSESDDWRYLNVRRLFIMLRRAIEKGTQWISFEPNTIETWSLIEREVSSFLSDLYIKGYFAGNSPEEAFIVKCDGETNAHEVVESGRLVTEIRVAPAIPAEFIYFTIDQQMGERVEPR